MPIETLLAVVAIYAVAGCVKGALGFGLPIVSITLLPFAVPLETALALNAIVLIITNAQQVVQGGAYREGATVAWPLILGMIVTIPPAAFFAAQIDPDALMIIVGSFVLIFLAVSLFDPGAGRLTIGRVPGGLLFGAASGIVGGLTSAPASVFVTYVLAMRLRRSVYMTALGIIMFAFGAFAALSYAVAGLLKTHHLLPGLAGIPAAIAGMALGDHLARSLSLGAFRRVVMIVLAVLAVLMIRKGLT